MDIPLTESWIKTPFGSTYLTRMGTGPLVFVIHGGPGFDHRYLVSSLAPIAENRTVIFYDQPGCGNSTTSQPPSFFDVFSHFRWLSHHISGEQEVGVIAHSWGALVLIAALLDQRLEDKPVAKFNTGLLMNPVPVCWDKYKLCAKVLLKRFSLVDRFRFQWKALFEADGDKIMDILLSYYVVDQKCLPTGSFALNKKLYLWITQDLMGFDYRDVLSQLPPLSAVVCSEDFITPDLITDLTPHFIRQYEMDGVGHFPFWEEPSQFEDILKSNFMRD